MTINVDGICPPVFEEIFRNARFAQGGNAVFEGRIRGNPQPQVVWTRKGLQMKGNDKHQMTYDEPTGKVSLVIKSIGPGDEGEYSCTALNPYGEAICTVYISPEATKTLKKSKSSHKLKTFGLMEEQQQQQQMMIQQKQQQQMSHSSFQQQSQQNHQVHHQQQQQMHHHQQQQQMHHHQQQQQQQMQTQTQHLMQQQYQETRESSSMMSKEEHQTHSSFSQKTSFEQLSLEQSSSLFEQGNNVIFSNSNNNAHQIPMKNGLTNQNESQSQMRRETSSSNQYSYEQKLMETQYQPTQKQQIHSVYQQQQYQPGQEEQKQQHIQQKQSLQQQQQQTQYQQQQNIYQQHQQKTQYQQQQQQIQIKQQQQQTQSQRPSSSSLTTEPEVIYLKHVERNSQTQKRDTTDGSSFSVYGPPHFLTPLRDVCINEGEKAVFDAKVSPIGDPSMTVEWYFNGIPIPACSRINSSCQFGFVLLNMLNSTPSDNGEYTCVIKNESGTFHSSCRLTVYPRKEITHDYRVSSLDSEARKTKNESFIINEPPPPKPEFIKSLVSQGESPEGSNIHLEAQVTPVSDNSMRIDWFKDGKSITASCRIASIFNFGYVSLNINNLRAEDSGTYSCRATNASGEALTNTTISVKVSSDLSASTGISEQSNYIQKVDELEQYQAYRSLKRSESVLESTTAPEFKTQIKNQHEIREGGFAHFEARLEPMGDQSMKVDWFKDGQAVEASSRITSFFNFGYVALTIKQVSEFDSGVYTCVATNALGKTETSASLKTAHKTEETDFQSKTWSSIQQMEAYKKSASDSHVQTNTELYMAPQCISQLKGTNVILEGQRAHFECRIEPQNDSNLTIIWLHNGKELNASSRIQTYYDFGYVSLDILDVKQEDSGTYTMIATNQLGAKELNIDLRVEGHISSVDTSSLHAKTLEETKRFELQNKTYQNENDVQASTSSTPPFFKTQLQSSCSVTEEQNIHLEARLEPSGDPSLRVEWFANGRPLTIGSRFRTYNDFGFIALDILGVRSIDEGIYTCKATNDYGTSETSSVVQVMSKSSIISETENESALEQIHYLESNNKHHKKSSYEELTFTEPPQFIRELKNVEVTEGQNIHLETRLTPVGDATMRVEWTVNGKPLKSGHKFRPSYDFDFVSLDLLSVYPEESGVYTCKASNAHGSASTSASVQILGGSNIISESNSHMEQFNVLEHKRTCKTEIEDSTPTIAPVFTTSLKNVDVREGQRAHFECKINPVSDVSLKIEWFLNGQAIQQGTRIKEGLDFGFVSLDIMYVYPEDEGTYTCKATNALGQSSNSASLTVKAKEIINKETLHEAALSQIHYLEQGIKSSSQEESITSQIPEFTVNLKDIVLMEGTSAHFEAKLIPIGDPTLRIDWLLNGKAVQASNRLMTLYDFGFVALDLKYTRPEDSGTYSCRATNSLGEATVSATMKILSVNDGLIAETLHEDALEKIALLENKKVEGNLVEEESISSIPLFVVPLQGKQNLIEGQNIHMECRLEPYPDHSLQIEWYHNGKPLPYGNKWKTTYDFGFAALDINGSYPEDSGTYTLKAHNILGDAESSLTVTIAARNSLLLDSDHTDALEKIKYLEAKTYRSPEEESCVLQAPVFGYSLKDIRVDESQPAHFETTLTPVNDATMKIEWLCNGQSIQQGHRYRTTYDFGFVALDILYAYPEDSGTYTVVARNSTGQTSVSGNLSVAGKASLLLDTLDKERLSHIRNLEQKSTQIKDEPPIQITIPVFTSSLQDVNGVSEQCHVHLECRLEPINDPNLRVNWFLNGKEISAGHRFRTTHDFGYVALDILYAYAEDSGTYTCRATNNLSSAENSCSVTVVSKKSLLLDSQHPQGWEKMKTLESKRHGSRLDVVDVPVGAPKFLTELMGKTSLSEGQTAHFEGQIEPIHDSNLKIEFTHNGKPLKQASRIHTLCDFGYVALDISELIAEDEGEYICRVFNKYGDVSSKINLSIASRSTLDTSSQRPEGLEKIKELENRRVSRPHEDIISFQKPVFTEPLCNIHREEGQKAVLEGRLIPIGDPSLLVQWFKDGQLISTGSRINTTHDFGYVSLHISSLRSDDVGVYECKATNTLGEAISTSSLSIALKGSLLLDSQHPEGMKKIAALEFSKLQRQESEKIENLVKPAFITTLSGSSQIEQGGVAHMECRVVPSNDSNMNFQWYCNGEPLQMGSRFQASHDFGFVTLDISACIPEDSGMYTVKAINHLGEASTSFALHVGPQGSVLKDPLQPESYLQIQELEASRNQKKKERTELILSQPPVFLKPLSSVGLIPEGQNIHVEALIDPQNDPQLRTEWELNGKALESGSRIKTTLDFGHVQLLINGVRSQDSGLYTCKAINALGEAVSTTSVNVEVSNVTPHGSVPVTSSPKFVTQFASNIKVSEGQSMHFEAKLTPVEDPDLLVEWFKDGKPLAHGHRFKTFHDFGLVILEIYECISSDSGVYECRATNKLGSDVMRGTFECLDKSNLILTPQVPGDMKTSTIESIQQLEANKMRSSTSTTLTHGVAPRFTLPIYNREDLAEGENAHFEARLLPTDDPNLTIEMFWNGKALKAGSRIRSFCDFGFVILEISPVYPEDSGEYMIRAKNSFGEAVTKAILKCSGKRNIILDSQLPRNMKGALDKIADLEGYGKTPFYQRQDSDGSGSPPKFSVALPDLLLTENSLAHFETQLTPINDSSMKLEWYHNGQILSAGSRIKTINDFGFVILEVANVLTRDSGTYSCKASNKYGEDINSCIVTVKNKRDIITDPQLPKCFRNGTQSIQRLEENMWQREEMIYEDSEGHPPTFLNQIKDKTVVEGQAAHFECRVEPVGDGSMKIEWFHDGNPICIGSRIHTLSDFGFVVLDIDWTFKRDSGVYICRATNKCGVAETKAVLSCKSKKDINFDSQLPSGMSLDKLKELEKGKVETRIEEETEITVPKFLTQIESRSVGEGEPTHFNCRVEPKHDSKCKVVWYHNDKELSSGHRFRITHEFGYVALDILYTYPEDEGVYVCKASNELGEDITSCELRCKELPGILLENTIPKGMKKSDYLIQMEASMKKYSQDLHLTEDDVYDLEKRQPPRFVTQITSITNLVEMQAAKFECQLAPVGDPKMTVEWFFNGKPLPYKNRFTPIYDFGYVAMNFGWVYPEDSGEYVCRATNLYGTDETKAMIKTSGKPGIIYDSQLPKGMASIDRIREMESGWNKAPELIESETEKFKPCFVTQPEPQVVQEGDWARFCCRVTGYPKPRVMWLLNGHTVINGSKHKLVYDGMWHFDIPKCRDIDGGKVEVIARNQCGEAYALTSLTVTPRHDDYRSVLKHNVKPWYEEDQKEINRQLEVLAKEERYAMIQKSHQKSYSSKNVSSSKPSEQTSTNSSIKTSMGSLQEKSIDYSQQTQMGSSTKQDIESSEQSSMEPSQKTSMNSSVEKSMNSSMEKSMNFSMEKSMNSSMEKSMNSSQKKSMNFSTEKSMNSSVEKSMNSSQEKSMNSSQETSMNSSIKKSMTSSRETSMTSVIQKSVHSSQSMTNWKENGIQRKMESSHQVNCSQAPLMAPKFTNFLRPMSVSRGDSAQFTVLFEGYPSPTVKWYRYNFPLNESSTVHISTSDTNSSLLISKTSLEDSGIFSCVLENKVGSCKSSTNLSVRNPSLTQYESSSSLTLKQSLKEMKIQSGDKIRFDIQFSSKDESYLKFYHNGNRITEKDEGVQIIIVDSIASLIILNAQSQHSGLYECIMKTDSGEAKCQVRCAVISPE